MTQKKNKFEACSLGESMGILPLFWKDVFFSVFFRSKDQRGLKNAFDQKKVVFSNEIGHFQVIFSVHLMVARK